MLACRRKHARWRGTQHRVAWEAPQSPLDSALRCGAQGGAPRSSSMDGGLRGAYSVPTAETPADAVARGGEEEATTGGPEEQKLLTGPAASRRREMCERESASVVGRPVQGP